MREWALLAVALGPLLLLALPRAGAIGLAGPAGGVLGLLLVYGVLRELVARPAALAAVALLGYATFLLWYTVYEPDGAPIVGFPLAAVVLAVVWRSREQLSPARAALLGLLIGIAAMLRWQNGALLLLPAGLLLPGLRARPADTLVKGALALGGFALGALPHIPGGIPHLGEARLLETLFSSRHGLLYWTPILWAGFLGYLPLARRRPRLALLLFPPVLVMTYANACSSAAWADRSFSNPGFDSLLPLLGIGIAAALDTVFRAAARRPAGLLAVAGGALVLWNLVFMQEYKENRIPRDDAVSFARVTEENARVLARWVGTPLAWPANWVFAARHDLPVEKYDVMVGKQLFSGENNLGGVIDLGDPRADPALLGEGWGARAACGSAACRPVLSRARVFAPLEEGEDIDLTVRAEGDGLLGVDVNGARVAELPLALRMSDLRVRVGRAAWRGELNEIAFTATGQARVDQLVFERVGPSR